ncbi:uncharacterized protein [Montipora capricornis]|uniref:uncharacterized protein n=1 Tax=Montipora capricornis TaxID=246305 RepID=UPI0035F21A83
MILHVFLYYLISTEVFTAAERCLKESFSGHTPKRHFKIYDHSILLLPLRLSFSRRASQQISTHVLRILLEEVLGYEDVILVSDESGLDIEKSLTKLSKCGSYRCSSSAVPDVMINTEVWVPSTHSYQSDKWIDSQLVHGAGTISSHGRFGWYLPTAFVEKMWQDRKIIAENWRALELKSVLAELSQNTSILNSQMNDLEHQKFCKSVTLCNDGWLHGSNCENSTQQCAVLLADFPDHYGGILSQQINSLNLNISVAWLGSQLKEIINQDQPFLLLNWEPSEITASKGLSRINFPSCRGNVSFVRELGSQQGNYDCDFPQSHLYKFSWEKIKENAPDVFHVLSNMYFDKDTLNSLLHKLQVGGGNSTSKKVACDWLRENRDVWQAWLPSGISNNIPVYIGGMFPLSVNEDAVWSRPGILEGAQMAVERINQDFKILNHYTFELIVKDTQCQTALTLSAFIEFMSQSHNNAIAGILGPACSVQTEIIAEVAPLYNTIVMGYSVEGISLADREKYPLFFRTSPSKAEFKFAYSAVFEFFGWKQFASLTDTNYVSSTVTATHQHLATKGVSLVFAGQVTNQENVDIKSYLRSLQESSAKIIIATLFESLARAVVCQAYLQGLTPQNGYVWFLPSWLASGWWRVDDYTHSDEHVLGVPCSTSDMQEFISGGYFSLSNAFFGKSWDIVQGGGTVIQWRQEYEKRVRTEGHAPSEYASFAYDGMWAYALALDKLFKSYPAGLDTIKTNQTTQLLKSFLQQTNFSGVSGPVSFSKGERYLPTVEIKQHFPSKVVTVGYVQPNMKGQCGKNRSCFTINETSIYWPKGIRPTDGRPEPFAEQECSVESFRAALGTSCTTAIAIINVTVIGLFLIVVITLIWICIKKRYDRKYRETQQRMEELGLMEHSVLHLDEWEIPRENIVINRKLGEGAFGAVCGGEVIGLTAEGDWVPVAVKSLKVGSLPEDKLEFLSEAETMKSFDHNNIVKLLGVCTKGEPAFAVMELMIHGDLKNFLLARRQFANQNCKEADDVTPTKLTKMGADITNGLAYLAEMNFVHRDLALRNCMVSSGYVVKLGDFGMARAMYDSDYYRFGRKAMLPIRWMAPESLADGLFTNKSDVWSLGVTLWELTTFGSFPYQGLSNVEVVDRVKLGRSMDKPQECTSELKKLLTECWRREPDYRPSPCKILKLFSAHPAMITACLDSPLSSVVTDDDWTEPDHVRNRSIRTQCSTPPPSLKRKCTIAELSREREKVLMPGHEDNDPWVGDSRL